MGFRRGTPVNVKAPQQQAPLLQLVGRAAQRHRV
jgi:hypothetical protein